MLQNSKKLTELEDGISDIDCEALNDIYYLWKNATNPEVKEAFDLMIKGGTPSQKDFGYEVPKFNTGIEILFWLAERNEFKQNDTLALAIAVVNGLYFVMGDKQVRKTLNSRVNERLVLGREIDEWQNVAFLNYSLEKSSLLGKLYWAWDGNENGVFGTNRLVDYFLSGKKIDISTYEKVAISSRELRIMKNFMSQKGLIMKNASDTITKLEEYLWFSSEGRLTFPNWAFSDLNDQDAGLLLNLLIGTGKGKGGCTTEYAVVDMRAKAIGIPTMAIFRNVYDNNGKFVMEYMHAIYYDSQTNTWEGYHNQLEKGDGNRSMDEIIRLFIMEAPIFYSEYFQEEHDSIDTIKSSPHYIIPAITRGQVAKMFEGGVSDLKMKQWLLYS